MNEGTPAASCSLCGGPVSPKNTSGFCRKNPACAKASQAVAQKRWYETHKEQQAAAWAAYSPGYKERRAELDRERYGERKRAPNGQGRSYAEKLAYVREYKQRPENAGRVREYNRRGRQKYMARGDRPCLSPGGCPVYAKVGSKFCPEHARVEATWSYHRTAEHRRQLLAERQSWICPWCSDYLPPSLGRTHVDHIIPRASGLVIEEDWNFQLLHGRCNQQKSGRITPQAMALAAEHGLSLPEIGSQLQLFLIRSGYGSARRERRRLRRRDPRRRRRGAPAPVRLPHRRGPDHRAHRGRRQHPGPGRDHQAAGAS